MARKETLKEQQDRLDKEKWCKGVTTFCDHSGMMWYCKDCPHQKNGCHCHATQIERERGSFCARNARRVKRS